MQPAVHMDASGWPAPHPTGLPDSCFGQLQPEPLHLATAATATKEAPTSRALASGQPPATQHQPAPSPQPCTSMSQWRWTWLRQHFVQGTLCPSLTQAEQDSDTDPDGTVLSIQHRQWLFDSMAATQQHSTEQTQPTPPKQTLRWADYEDSDEEFSAFEPTLPAPAPPMQATATTGLTPQNLIDIHRWAASQHTGQAHQPAPLSDPTAPPDGFTFPDQPHTTAHPSATPETFCGMHLNTAPTHVPATSAHPQSPVDFLDQYFQQYNLSHGDEDQYDAFNDHQLAFHHY